MNGRDRKKEPPQHVGRTAAGKGADKAAGRAAADKAAGRAAAGRRATSSPDNWRRKEEFKPIRKNVILNSPKHLYNQLKLTTPPFS